MSNDNFENTPPQGAPDPSSAAPVSENKKSTGNTKQKEGWEREILEKLAFAALKEQRARRRMGNFLQACYAGDNCIRVLVCV